MATTREKVLALVEHLQTMPPGEMSDEGAELTGLYQIMVGMGFDPLPMLVPSSDAEADILVDKVIGLLLAIRGDDLPPFDPDRYGEAGVAGDVEEARLHPDA